MGRGGWADLLLAIAVGGCDTSSQETPPSRQTAPSQARAAPCDLDEAKEILGALEDYEPPTPGPQGNHARRLCPSSPNRRPGKGL